MSRTRFRSWAMHRTCGNQIPPEVTTTGNEMQIILRTDGSLSHRGFSATWSTDEPARCGGILREDRARFLFTFFKHKYHNLEAVGFFLLFKF